eukprot:11441060-Alexandrium_andersonii.AAC.1
MAQEHPARMSRALPGEQGSPPGLEPSCCRPGPKPKADSRKTPTATSSWASSRHRGAPSVHFRDGPPPPLPETSQSLSSIPEEFFTLSESASASSG